MEWVQDEMSMGRSGHSKKWDGVGTGLMWSGNRRKWLQDGMGTGLSGYVMELVQD